jgi:predicted nucleotidyltransferase component of viral defense system
MKKEIKDYSASVHDRLLNHAKKIKRPFDEILQYYAVERFLYRFSRSKHKDKAILKGAMMFIVWDAPYSRATRDIDMLGLLDNDIDNFVRMAQDTCKTDVEPDGMMYDADSVKGEQIIEDGNYKGVRVRFLGYLGRARASMQIDFGFGDVVFPKPQTIDYPTILAMPAPQLKGYSRETVIAEKFHVMVDRGLLNSRMKDFYDIWLLSNHFDFTHKELKEAIKKTFSTRKTRIIPDPVALTDAFVSNEQKNVQWKAFVRKQKLGYAPENIRDVIKVLREFLLPIISNMEENQRNEFSWVAPGPWKNI